MPLQGIRIPRNPLKRGTTGFQGQKNSYNMAWEGADGPAPDPRGEYSIDLQTLRLYPSNVPIAGREYPTRPTQGGICIGQMNASGDWAVCLGQNNDSCYEGSTALGRYAHAYAPGMLAYGGGPFSSPGDCQFVVRTCLRAETKDATPTVLTNRPQSVNPDGATFWGYGNKVYVYNVYIIGEEIGGVNCLLFQRRLVIRQEGQTATLVQNFVVGTDVKTDPTWGNPTIEIHQSSYTLRITVTGKAGTYIRWVALVYGQEISYPILWHEPGALKRRRFTVRSTNIPANLTNYPLFVRIPYVYSGEDVRFYTVGGDWLPHDFEPSDSGGFCWVKVPILRSGTLRGYDNTYYAYYDGEFSTSLTPQLMEATWSDYDLVSHHFGGGDRIYAAKPWELEGLKAAINRPREVSGRMAYGQHSETTDAAWINYGSSIGAYTDQNFGVNLWFRQDNSDPSLQFLIGRQRIYGTGDTDGWMLCTDIQGRILFYWRDENGPALAQTGTGVFSLNTWYNLAFSRVGTSVMLYLNGSPVTMTPERNIGTIVARTRNLYIQGDDPDSYRFRGIIDEVRLKPASFSVAESIFGYHNVNSTDNEINWGAEENRP